MAEDVAMTRPTKWRLHVLRIWSRRCSVGVLVGLFIARAVNTGECHHWASLVMNLADSPVWPVVFIGSVAACAFPFVGAVRVAYAWIVILVLLADLDVLCGLIAWFAQLFYLVVEVLLGIVAFATHTLRATAGLLRWSVGAETPGLQTVEWAAGGLVQLWIFRLLYLLLSMRLERLRAHRLIETCLRGALQRPFRPEFGNNFGPSKERLMESQAVKALDRVYTVGTSAVEIQALEEKHAALLVARRAALEDQVEYADMMPDTLVVDVRRDHLLEDSWRYLLNTPAFELLAPEFKVTYLGEKGADEGGLMMDWFDAVGQVLVEGADDDNGSSLLALGKSSSMLIPRPAKPHTGGTDCCQEEADEDRYRQLFLVGRFLALGVVHGGRPLPLPLSPLVCKYLIGEPIDMGDIEALDPAFFRERVKPFLNVGGRAEMEAALGEPLTFMSVPTECRPQAEELLPGGASMAVTDENLADYLQLLCDAFLCGEIRQELQCLLRGFWDVLPLDALRKSALNVRELALLVAGNRGLDLVDWRGHTRVEEEGAELVCNSNASAAVNTLISWFWSVLQDFDEDQLRMVLHFATGSRRLPPGGFAALNPVFTIAVSEVGSPEHLPYAHTCVHRLVLYRYKTLEQLRSKLMQALAVRDFGFA